MLKLILIITLCAPDLSAMESAYTSALDFSVVERGAISSSLASVWAAPKMRGHAYTLLRSVGEANVYLRFIQLDATPSYRPMRTFGWNGAIIPVQDLAALTAKIHDGHSGFQIVEESQPSAIRVVGPAREVLSLTGDPAAAASVRLVLAVPDLPMTQRFFHDRLEMEVGKTTQAPNAMLSEAFSLDADTKHPFALVHLAPTYSIELNGFPMKAKRRPQRKGELPPALSIVTFKTASLDSVRALLISAPKRISSAPYNGRRVAAMRGTALELIEVVEDVK